MENEKVVNKVVTDEAPIINQVILIEGGRGGLKIKYKIPQSINGVLNGRNRVEENLKPVQKEIRGGFSLLREHLLSGCEYYWPNDNIKKILLAKCVVTTVALNIKGGIQLKGHMVSSGSHHAALVTPVLDPDDYKEFSTLSDLIDGIMEESKLFLAGVKGADVKTIVTDYMTVKKDVVDAEDVYSKMTQADIDEITREALEDSGLTFVMEGGQMVIAPAHEEEDAVTIDVSEEEEVEEAVEVVTEDVDIAEPEFQEPNGQEDELFIS